jgi:hypothetical protein
MSVRIALGPESFQIDFAEYYVDTTRVYDGDEVEVDPLVAHSIRCRYRVKNVGASAIHWWESCFTLYDVTHGRAIGSANDHCQGWLSTTKDRTINIPNLITEPTVLRARIWANQDYNALPPPQGSW